MIRYGIPTAVLFVAFSFACDNAADAQRKMNGARAEADRTIDAAIQEADQKMLNAQQQADKKIAEAQADFMKLREDYRHTATTNLVDLDHKVDNLEGKARISVGKTRTDLDTTLKQIHVYRDAFQSDCRWLETVTASSWDEARVRLDKEWLQLKTLVDKA